MATQSQIFKRANVLIKQGHDRKQAFAIAYDEMGKPTRKSTKKTVKKNPAKPARAVKKTAASKRNTRGKNTLIERVSQLTKKKPSARLVARRKKNLKAPRGVFPNPMAAASVMRRPKAAANFREYVVEKATENSPWSQVAHFQKLADAKEYANALSVKYPSAYIRVLGE